MKITLVHRIGLAFAALLTATAAQAGLQRLGPTDSANGGYPAWYQDSTGIALDFGKPITQAELNGGWLLILPANLPTGAVPEVPFTNYSAEHFYWNATSGLKVGGGVVLVLSMEGAFANTTGPIAGDQIVFGRLRIKVTKASFDGDYKVYTPYGVFDFPNVRVGDRIFSTQDVGFTCGTDFSCALNSLIGPYLLPSAVPGGAEVPPYPDLKSLPGVDPFYDAIAAKTADPLTGRKYLTDPARVGPLTGGTCALTPGVIVDTARPGDCVLGNAITDPKDAAGKYLLPARPVYKTGDGSLRDPNLFRVEVFATGSVPSQATLVGTESSGMPENHFTTAGRLYQSADAANPLSIPGKVVVNRATYARPATGPNKLDVFVTAFPSMNARLPAGATVSTSRPDMGYYDTACGTDAAGKPTAPTTTGVSGVPVTYIQMFRSSATSNLWWGQNAPVSIPNEVCVLDNGRVVPGYFPANVTDSIDITSVLFDPTTTPTSLVVNVTGSDCFTSPDVTLEGFGPMSSVAGTTCNYALTVPNLQAPPAQVAVTSLRGGTASRLVQTTVGTPTLMNQVVTVADSVTLPEDCSLAAPQNPATGCAAAQVIDILANDTYNGGPVPAGATVAIATAPANGTATWDAANRKLDYTPKLNFNGADLIGYTVAYTDPVTGTTSTSAEGYVHITVTPVNDIPTAADDASGAPNGKPITLNLLANDTDVDGVADLGATAAAVIQSLPAAGATLTCNGGVAAVIGTACSGGNVTFTGNGGGAIYSFTYKARDASGALSSNTATVTMTVNATEAIVVQKSIFTAKSLRWTVTGTDSLVAGQTLSITYDIATPPTYKKNGVCTAMTAADNPVIGTATVDALGAWSYDTTVSSAGFINPTNTGSNGTGFWCSPPKSLKITSPLGGSATTVISFK